MIFTFYDERNHIICDSSDVIALGVKIAIPMEAMYFKVKPEEEVS